MSGELSRLRDLLDRERVKLGVSIRQMNAPGSPVYRVRENVAVPVAVLAASLAGTIWLHTWIGLALLLVGAGYWAIRIQPRVKEGVFDRTAVLALSGEGAFDALWAKGALSLYARLPDGSVRVATRKEDWRAFVRAMPEEGRG